jgi:hypothetical protein
MWIFIFFYLLNNLYKIQNIFIITENYYYSNEDLNVVIYIVDLSNSLIVNKKIIALIILVVAIILGLISIYILISTGILPLGDTDGKTGG